MFITGLFNEPFKGGRSPSWEVLEPVVVFFKGYNLEDGLEEFINDFYCSILFY